MSLEEELRDLQCWQPQPPTAKSLLSTQPFCIDTLSFAQWLQFVFIVRIQALIDTGQPLPQKCAITPMAEEFFRQHGFQSEAILEMVRQIDEILM